MLAMPTIRGVVAAAMVAFVSLAAVTPAQAIVVTGRWDPQYGVPFSGVDGDMWWSGSAKFNIKDSCVPTGSQLVTAQTCGAGNMYVENAVVNLALSDGGTPFATLTFQGIAEIFVADFVNGQLEGGLGVLSDYFMPWIVPVLTNPAINPFNVTGYAFNLAFSLDGALLYHASAAGIPKHDHGHDDTTEFWHGVGNGHLATPCSALPGAQGDTVPCGFSDNYGVMHFDEIPGINPHLIPEPQTYVLMLLGLGAIGFSARRRQRNAR